MISRIGSVDWSLIAVPGKWRAPESALSPRTMETNMSKLPRWIGRLVCLVRGHQWKRSANASKKLDNSRSETVRCLRCGKTETVIY